VPAPEIVLSLMFSVAAAPLLTISLSRCCSQRDEAGGKPVQDCRSRMVVYGLRSTVPWITSSVSAPPEPAALKLDRTAVVYREVIERNRPGRRTRSSRRSAPRCAAALIANAVQAAGDGKRDRAAGILGLDHAAALIDDAGPPMETVPFNTPR